MKATSIHLQPCKNGSENHNLRKKANLKHVRYALTDRNEWWSSVSSLEELRKEIRNLVKEKTGRTMQKKAQPLYEGVVVIKEDTTMEQLKEIGRRFADRWGITLVQASIQRDEGIWKNSKGEIPKDENGHYDPNIIPADPDYQWHPNFHAHLVFDYYNHETGRSCKVPYKTGAEEMQTICAQVLGMERGVASDRKHLDAMAYKAHLEHGKLEHLEEERKRKEVGIEQLCQKEDKLKKSVRGLTLKDSVLGLLGAGKVRTLEENNENLTQSVSDLKEEFQSELKRTEQRHRQEMAVMQEKHGQEIEGYKDLIRRAEGFLKMSLSEFCKKAGERLRKSLAERKTQVQAQAKHRGLGM